MFRLSGLIFLLSAAWALCAAGRPGAREASPEAARAALARLPLRFEANQGQFDPAARFVARGGNYTLLLTPGGPVVAVPGAPKVALALAGSNPHAALEPLDRLPSRTDYYIGRENWHTGVASYRRVRYRSVYPGIDMVYYGNQSLLEYDFVLQPGADPQAIAMRFNGAAQVGLSPSGDLVLETAGRKIVQRKPYVYQQEPSGARREIAGSYRLMSDGSVKLQLAGYDRGKPLVIDPVLEYCTYIGGTGTDQVNAAKLLPNGRLYIAGQTDSGQIPYINGAFNNDFTGLTDIFVQILDTTPAGGFQQIYSSYIGGANIDIPNAIDVDAKGIMYVAGSTTSTDFPMAGNSYQASGAGTNQAGIVFQLDPSGYGGVSLLYASYLSGTTGNDSINGIAVDANQVMYMIGTARSSDFPVSLSAYQSALWGTQDTFLAQMDPNAGTLGYCSYLGGEDVDDGRVILLGPNNLVYFGASTLSTQFPMAGYNYSATPFGGWDVIIGIMDFTKQGNDSLVFSTYFGGSANDELRGMSFDANGNLALTGYTLSQDFPLTADAMRSTYGGNTNAFVTLLNLALPFQQSLVYSTYLGGTGGDVAYAVQSDAAGNLYAVGYTLSSDFPVTANAVQGAWGGGTDLFVTKFKRGARGAGALIFSTYLGTQADIVPTAMQVGADGTVYVEGFGGVGLPTSPSSYQGGYAGGPSDGFVLVIGDPPGTNSTAAAKPGR